MSLYEPPEVFEKVCSVDGCTRWTGNIYQGKAICDNHLEDDDYEELSNCCGAEPANEVIDGLGICSECREHADFESEDESDYESPSQDELWQRGCDIEHREAEAKKLK